MAVCWQKDGNFVPKVTELCYDHYRKLGKKGKPQEGREWALVAAIICVEEKGLCTQHVY